MAELKGRTRMVRPGAGCARRRRLRVVKKVIGKFGWFDSFRAKTATYSPFVPIVGKVPLLCKFFARSGPVIWEK